MIKNFRHRGLQRLFEDDERRRLPAAQVDKIARVLARLEQISQPQDMDLPGHRLHPLRGDLKGFWSVTIHANWRVIFRCDANGNVYDVDYLDYH